MLFIPIILIVLSWVVLHDNMQAPNTLQQQKTSGTVYFLGFLNQWHLSQE